MTVDQAVSVAMTWLHRIIGIALLVLIAATIIKFYGVRLPIPTVGHEVLAYLSGAYYLARK